MPHRRNLVAIALGALLVFVAAPGCAYARVVSVGSPDKHDGKLAVYSEVNLLWPHERICQIVVNWNDWEGHGAVFMSPNAPQPETIVSSITEWKQVARDPNVARDTLRARFIFNGGVISERMFPAPAGLDLVVSGRAPREPASPDDREPAESWAARKAPLSTDIDAPTVHDWKKELVCKVEKAQGALYATVTPPSGSYKVTIDVRSEGDPRLVLDITPWWVELLTAEGEPTATEKHGFIESGNEIRSIEYWELDGRPRVIKLATGSEPGDSFRVRFEKSSPGSQ